MALEEFRNDVSNRMLSIYGIGWDDACGDINAIETALFDGWSVEEFVDWFGRKHDLDPLSAFGIGPR